jgi:hypothetical protein
MLAGCLVFTLAIAAIGCMALKRKHAGDENLAAMPGLREALGRAAAIYPEPLRGIAWSHLLVFKTKDGTLYQLQGMNARGRPIELEITDSGRVIEIEEYGIPLAEVPAVVMKGLETKIPFANPDWTEAIYQAGQPRPAVYGFGGRDGNGNRIAVYLTADGQTVLN